MTDTPSDMPEAVPPLSEWETLSILRRRRDAEVFALNKAELLNALTLAGVTHVVVTFDGYSDSGQIESVEARAGDDEIAIPSAVIEIGVPAWGQSEPERSSVNIATAIETLAYDVLEQTHCGWENNDGAYGDVTFDVTAHTITLDYNERYTASENHTHSF